jgi:hypothetical protein
LKRDCKQYNLKGFEVFTVVVMKSIIFWDMMPCSPLSCNRHFGGTYRLHLQGRRIISARTSRQAGSNSTDYTAPYPKRWYSSIWKELNLNIFNM